MRKNIWDEIRSQERLNLLPTRGDSSSQPITFPLSRGSSPTLTQCTSKKTKWKHKKVKIYTSWWNNLGLKRIKNKLRHAKDTNLEIWTLFCVLQWNIFDHSRTSSQEETPNLWNPQSKGSCLNKTQTHWNIKERHQCLKAQYLHLGLRGHIYKLVHAALAAK